MIIDYIGQELIWKLLGIHPYQENNPHYMINIRCQTPQDNKHVKDVILKHITMDKIYNIDTFEYKPFVYLTRKIFIKNVFGSISEARFINEFTMEII